MKVLCFILSLLGLLLLAPAPSLAAPTLEIVQAADAPEGEQLAAKELAAYAQQLSEVEVKLVQQPSKGAAQVIFLGSPQTNPAVKQVLGDKWPKLSEQGIVLVSLPAGLVVGGGSPQATRWAVQELAQRWGVVHLLTGSSFPEAKQPLKLAAFNVILEPQVEQRAWRTGGDSILQGIGWPLAEQQKLIAQLGRLKFNHLVLELHATQPFLSYSIDQVAKKSGAWWAGEEFMVEGDTPGRDAFAGAKVFSNPDLAAPDVSGSAKKWLQGVLAAARQQGMTVEFSVSALEFPAEFAPVLKQNSLQFKTVNDVLVLLPETATLKKAAMLANVQLVSAASLDKTAQVSFRWPADLELDPAVKGAFLKELQALAPAKSQRFLLPDQAQEAPPSAVALSDEQVGVLAQLPLTKLADALKAAGGKQGSRVELTAGVLGELDAAAYYFSRAAFEPKLTPQQAVIEMFAALTGHADSAQRVWNGWEAMDHTTALMEQEKCTLAQPDKQLFERLYRAEPLPAYFAQLTADNGTVTTELYRALSNCSKRGHSLVYYCAKRGEYVGFYLAMVEALNAAAQAKQKGDKDLALEKLEVAVESLNDAMDTLGDVARNPGDQALIALLAARLYRPLMTEYEKLVNAVEEGK